MLNMILKYNYYYVVNGLIKCSIQYKKNYQGPTSYFENEVQKYKNSQASFLKFSVIKA